MCRTEQLCAGVIMEDRYVMQDRAVLQNRAIVQDRVVIPDIASRELL